jgi:hypothetical protein
MLNQEIAELFPGTSPRLIRVLTEEHIFQISNQSQSGLNYIKLRQGGKNGASSAKLSNLLVNWRRLLAETPDMVLQIIGGLASKYLIPLAILSTIAKLQNIATLTVSENHATALCAMWTKRDAYDSITPERAFEETNTLLKHFRMNEMARDEFDQVLEDLAKLSTLKVEAGNIALMECITFSLN